MTVCYRTHMSNHPVKLNREGFPISCEHPADEPCVPPTDAEIDRQRELAEYRREQADWQVEA